MSIPGQTDPRQKLQAEYLAAYRRFTAEQADGINEWHFAVHSLGDEGPPRIVGVAVAEAAASLVVYAPQRNEEIRPATPEEIAAYRTAA